MMRDIISYVPDAGQFQCNVANWPFNTIFEDVEVFLRKVRDFLVFFKQGVPLDSEVMALQDDYRNHHFRRFDADGWGTTGFRGRVPCFANKRASAKQQC
jgi:hypothetical protein